MADTANDRPEPRLTAKQKRFIAEYVIDRNATQAYYRAFGRTTRSGSRRSYQSARKAASLLLTNPHIRTELAAAEREHRRRCRVTVERIIRELAAVAFADPDDLYEPDPQNHGLPTPRPWRDVPPAARKVIAGVRVKRRRLVTTARDKSGNPRDEAWEVEEISYKHRDPDAALDKLMRRLGLYDATFAEALKAIAALQAEIAELKHGELGKAPEARNGPAGGIAEGGGT